MYTCDVLLIVFCFTELAIRPSLESILIPAHVSKVASSASPPTSSSGSLSQEHKSGTHTSDDSTLLSKPGPSELNH